MMSKIIKHKKILILLFVLLFLNFIFNSRFRMYHLPTGEYIESVESPDGKHTIKSYRYSGGMTMDWSLRVEVVDNTTMKKTNIYWRYHDSDSDMKWLDNETVIINGKKLNVYKDYYFKE